MRLSWRRDCETELEERLSDCPGGETVRRNLRRDCQTVLEERL